MKRGNSLRNFIRGLFIFLSLLLVSMSINVSHVKAEYMFTPGIEKAYVSQQNIGFGSQLVFTIELYNDEERAVKQITANYENWDTGSHEQVILKNRGNNVFTATRDITLESEPGLYKIESVEFFEDNGQYSAMYEYSNNYEFPYNLSYSIERHDGSIGIETATINIDEARNNDLIKYSFELNNLNRNNINTLKLIIKNIETNEYQNINLIKQSLTHYTGQKFVDSSISKGTWVAEELVAKTDKGNEYHIKGEDAKSDVHPLKNLRVLVTDKKKDIYGPVLKYIKSDKKVYKPNDVLHLSLNAIDVDDNGVKNAVVIIEEVNTKKKETIHLFENAPGSFTYNKELTPNEPNSEWIVNSIKLTDNKENVTNLSETDVLKITQTYPFFEITQDGKPSFRSPTINEKFITDKSTSISGVSNSNGTVFVLANNKVIGKANTINGKFKVKFNPVKAGSTLTVYTELNKVKSKAIAIKVKKAPAQKVVVATPVINQKYISNKTTSISGASKSNGTVYVLAKNKVIGKANISKGKFLVKFKALSAGTNVSVYTVQNKVKSKYVNFKVVDKIAPKPPVVNKVTTRSIKVTGSGEKNAQVTVYKGKTLIAKSAVNNKGKFTLKINKQKKNTVLDVYLMDKTKNKSKPKSIKVS